MTSAPVPILSAAQSAAIEEHAFSETAKEVGGILVGRLTEDGADVSGVVPALKAEGAATHVTFTHEVWADVMDTIDRDFPGQQVVGWYHTHPSFGLFLSEYDLFIHRNFFPDSRMVALVVDPVAGELGWFGHSGKVIVEIGRAKTSREPVRHEAAARQAAVHQRSSLRTLASAAVGLSLAVGVGAFVWGRSTAPAEPPAQLLREQVVAGQGIIEDQRATIDTQEEQIGALEDQVSAMASDPSDTPAAPGTGTGRSTVTVLAEVQTGDSWWSLAERYLGDGTRYVELMRANPRIAVLQPATTVAVPGVGVAGDGSATP
jgi:proteasome lid subunit RPN8/RPN11